MSSFKDYIGAKDIRWWDGIVRTFTRLTSTGGSLTQNKIGSVVDILEVYGQGDTYTDATLSAAIEAIQSNACTILFQPGIWTIANSVTIPATISILVPQGAILSISAGKTLTINGAILSGSYVFFDGAGTVAGSPILTEKNAYWFSGTVTDSTTPAYKAITVGALTASTSVSVDTISEKTLTAGVTIDGVKLKDSEPYCDVINEKTAAAGVTIDGVKLKDSEPYCNVINEKTATVGVTVDGVLLKDSQVTTDTINEKTAAAGVTIDSCLIKDGVVVSSHSLAMDSETIASGTDGVTSTVAVTNGDRILVIAKINGSAAGAGYRVIRMGKNVASSATVQFATGDTNSSEVDADFSDNTLRTMSMVDVCQVTGTGNLILYVNGPSGWSAGYTATIYYAFLKKQ